MNLSSYFYKNNYLNYALDVNTFTKSTIKKFIVKITEHDKIEAYPPLK